MSAPERCSGQLPRVLEAGRVRVHDTREASNIQGTGIGLVLSERLVEVMGGAIGASSSVGKGSMFWFELDSAEAPDTRPVLPVKARRAP